MNSSLINHKWIIDRLFELGCEKRQRELWLSDGSSGEWSCLAEAYCGLFDDSALCYKLDSGGTEFGVDVDSSLRRLEKIIVEIDDHRTPEEVIADPRMATVREMASGLLGRILLIGSRDSERIVRRLLELRDEERQRRLWVPADNPRSSLKEVYWHLFTGDDYWGYLDLGARKQELSSMFSQLEELVADLEPYRARPPTEFITDPKMAAVRETASGIAQKLGRLGIPIPRL